MAGSNEQLFEGITKRLENPGLHEAFESVVKNPDDMDRELETISRCVDRVNELINSPRDEDFEGINYTRVILGARGLNQLPSPFGDVEEPISWMRNVLSTVGVANVETGDVYRSPEEINEGNPLSVFRWYLYDGLGRMIAIRLGIPEERGRQLRKSDWIACAITEAAITLAEEGDSGAIDVVSDMVAMGFIDNGWRLTKPLVERGEKVARREQKMQGMEDFAVIRFSGALPEIEQAVFDHPNIDSERFEAEYDRIAIGHRLSATQHELAVAAFDQYSSDREAVVSYQRELFPGLTIDPGDPFKRMNEDDAKRLFLEDISDDPIDEEMLSRFEFENVSPACFVVKFNGRPEELKFINGEGIRIASGVFYQRLGLTGEEAEADPDKKRRLDLLSRRVIFYCSPDWEYRGHLLGTPEETRLHELRHYLFGLYWRDLEDSEVWDARRIETLALNELQARLISAWRGIEIDDLLPELSEKDVSGGFVDLGEYPVLTADMVDLLYEVSRTLGGGLITKELVGTIVLMSQDMKTAVRRLRRFEGGNPINAFEGCLGSVSVIKRDGQERKRKNNVSFLRAVISKFIESCPSASAARDFGRRLNHDLESHTIFGIGVDHDDKMRNGPVVIAEIESLQDQLTAAGYKEAAECLEPGIENVIERMNSARQDALWRKFVERLPQESPALFEEYEAAGRAVKYPKLARRKYEIETLMPVFETWRGRLTAIFDENTASLDQIPPEYQAALDHLIETQRAYWESRGQEVVAVYVYGSVPNGRSREGSDLDALTIVGAPRDQVDDADSWIEEQEWESTKRFGFQVDFHTMSHESLENAVQMPFIIRASGALAYGEDVIEEVELPSDFRVLSRLSQGPYLRNLLNRVDEYALDISDMSGRQLRRSGSYLAKASLRIARSLVLMQEGLWARDPVQEARYVRMYLPEFERFAGMARVMRYDGTESSEELSEFLDLALPVLWKFWQRCYLVSELREGEREEGQEIKRLIDSIRRKVG